jgi:hypothetical protein
MPKQEEGCPNVQKNIQNRPKDLTDVSRAVLRSEQAKRWTKKYRTEVAASSSSLLSTFSAVCEAYLGNTMSRVQVLIDSSILWIPSRPDYKRMSIFPTYFDHC